MATYWSYLLLEVLYVEQIQRLIIIILAITKRGGRETKKKKIQKSQQVTGCFTLIIYNPIVIIVQYDIFLKYCQRRFCLIFGKRGKGKIYTPTQS